MTGWLRRQLGERTLIFLLAFLIATVLWLFVRESARQVTIPGRPGSGVKTVPVVPTVAGAPAEGFAVRAIEVTPSTVTIAGPAGVVEGIDVVPTATVRIDGATRDVVETVDLRVPPGVWTSGGVTVRVGIDRLVVRALVPDVPVEVVGAVASAQVTVAPPQVTVEVEGPPAALAPLGPSDFRVVADVAGLAPGTPHSVRPQVRRSPPRVQVRALHPPTLSVTVRRP
ncbi:MAG: CdaR family protein [Armatimonadota bacterium]|nr:CdaR family protein [Armatimonadota bacterium]